MGKDGESNIEYRSLLLSHSGSTGSAGATLNMTSIPFATTVPRSPVAPRKSRAESSTHSPVAPRMPRAHVAKVLLTRLRDRLHLVGPSLTLQPYLQFFDSSNGGALSKDFLSFVLS